ncbi:MAG: hypothetical protein MRERV_46c017 [Mycoplasmataceae bacterium RV_VA103A]|nr:MAG: hypothetical protein MRERV_46c017 [Mycoplasmataceae bacterium RV_VA103A]
MRIILRKVFDKKPVIQGYFLWKIPFSNQLFFILWISKRNLLEFYK